MSLHLITNKDSKKKGSKAPEKDSKGKEKKVVPPENHSPDYEDILRMMEGSFNSIMKIEQFAKKDSAIAGVGDAITFLIRATNYIAQKVYTLEVEVAELKREVAKRKLIDDMKGEGDDT